LTYATSSTLPKITRLWVCSTSEETTEKRKKEKTLNGKTLLDRTRCLLVFAIILCPLMAHAVAALPDQILCMRRKIVVARVESGVGETAPPGDTRTGVVRLSIVITEELTQPKGDPSSELLVGDASGRPIEMSFTVIHARGYLPPSTDSGDLVGPEDGPLTDADILNLYVGKSFIFSIDSPSAPHPSASMWPLSAREWVMKTILRTGGWCSAKQAQ